MTFICHMISCRLVLLQHISVTYFLNILAFIECLVYNGAHENYRY